MYISSFHIDGFGVLSQVGVEQLPPGLSIFLGKNEAGKSTCLDFFRTMLTGHVVARGKKAQGRSYMPQNKAAIAGGFLGLQTKQHGLVRLTRRLQKSNDEVVLTDAQGNILESKILDSILFGITREVYRNVFGFSLNELQVFDSLDSEGVRHALYGASFGMSLRPPGKVIEEFTNYMNKQFRHGGANPAINTALTELELVQKQIYNVQSTCARFDSLTIEKNNLEAYLEDVRKQKNESEKLRHTAERQLGVWRQWDEWRTIESRLARLEEVPGSFPEDGPARLERAQELRQEAARRVHTQKERCQKLENMIAELTINASLLEQFTFLQSLSERKTSFRQAQSGLVSQNAALQRSQALLERYLSDLGPQWTCERIRKTDRSLFARGEMEKQATELQAAEQTYLAAMNALEKTNKVIELADFEHASAKDTLKSLPHPSATLNDTERNNVRSSIAQIENAQKILQEKQETLKTATQSFQRTLNPLQIRSTSNEDQKKIIQKLNVLLENQGQALEIAEECAQAAVKTRNAEHGVSQAQETEDRARVRLERVRRLSQENSTSTKSALDARASAVRLLRALYNNYSAEKERLAELTERINTSIAPAPVKSVVLMVIGFIVLGLGLAGIIVPMHWDITEIQITPRLIIPLSQWSAYLVVVTGAAFLAGGLPRSGPETKRFELEQKQLLDRAKSMQLRIAEMEGNIQEQCVTAQVQAADNVTLDAVELLLEREREQFAANERLGVEIDGLDAEYTAMHDNAKQKREILSKAQAEEQQARLRWHNHLRAHNVEAIPAPDAATAFFARVEAATLAHANLHTLQEEIVQLELQVQEHSDKLTIVAPIADILEENAKKHLEIVQNQVDLLENAEDNTSQVQPQEQDIMEEKGNTLQDILLASARVLEACREADEAQSERLKAEALLHNALHNRELANKAQEDAMQTLSDSEKKLEVIRAAWMERLQSLSMDMQVSPAMLRAALDSMERCLSVELEISGIQEEIQRHENECAALVNPLRTILDSVAIPLPTAATTEIPFQEDWLSLLDALLSEAQIGHDNSRLQEQYKVQLETQEFELHEASKALSDAKATEDNLLHLGKTNSVDEFIRLAAVRAENRTLLQRKADLEDALRLAAADNNFEEYLLSFEETDQHERQMFINSMQARIDDLIQDDQEKSATLAGIVAELNTLTSADTLAQLRQQEADLQENIEQRAYNWSSYALARQLLLQAKQRFESERQPQVIRMASDIFSTITNGSWQGITAKLDENSLQVFPPHGAPTSPLNLSRGTQEQLYLALRLAYIKNHAEHATPLPVIMDDILVNFDPERAKNTAKALLQLSQGAQKHQILFFTCHPHVADMLQEINPESQRFMVQGGQIQSS